MYELAANLDGWTWADVGEVGPYFHFNKHDYRLHYIAMHDGIIKAAFGSEEEAVSYVNQNNVNGKDQSTRE